MKKLNIIIVYSKDEKKLLMCERAKDPYKGKLNFVGGKVEPGEDETDAAYRELYEETGISEKQIRLTRVMNFQYFLADIELEVFAGKLTENVNLKEEVNRLVWVDRSEDFCDAERFAGNKNIEHMILETEEYRNRIFDAI